MGVLFNSSAYFYVNALAFWFLGIFYQEIRLGTTLGGFDSFGLMNNNKFFEKNSFSGDPILATDYFTGCQDFGGGWR